MDTIREDPNVSNFFISILFYFYYLSTVYFCLTLYINIIILDLNYLKDNLKNCKKLFHDFFSNTFVFALIFHVDIITY